MSECERYEFGDPIWVKTSGGEKEGFYGETAGTAGLHWCVRRCDTGLVNGSWFKDDDIRPRPVAEPARTGWRLPEPGDVVMRPRDIHAGEFVVYAVHWDNPRPLLCKGSIGGSQRFNLWEVELVRLHDAPKPFFEPAEDITASKINEALRLRPRPAKQGIIDNATLELAAVALEQHGQDRIAAMVRDLQRDWSEAS